MNGHTRQNKRQYSATELGYFDESKHPRAKDGRFGEKPGEQKGEERPSDKPKGMTAKEIASEEKKISKELDSVEAGLKGETDEVLLEDLRGDKERLLERISELAEMGEAGGGKKKLADLPKEKQAEAKSRVGRLAGLEDAIEDLTGNERAEAQADFEDQMSELVDLAGDEKSANALRAEFGKEFEKRKETAKKERSAVDVRAEFIRLAEKVKNEKDPDKRDKLRQETRGELGKLSKELIAAEKRERDAKKEKPKKENRQSSAVPPVFGTDKQNMRSYSSKDLN